MSTRAVAQALGMPAHTSYTYYEAGFKGATIPVELAKRLADLFERHGVDRSETLTLAGILSDEPFAQVDSAPRYIEQPQTGMARVAEVDDRASAGDGTIMDDIERPETIYEWQVPRELLRSATYAPAERIRIITVIGDSMESTFRPYERVMVDTTDTVPSPPGVFVVYDGLGLVVKRLEHIPHSDPPRVRISSDNPRYSPYERTIDEAYIQGRVLGRWQWV
jgi:phage repressor protein C with HTH and peptisase S24 domain